MRRMSILLATACLASTSWAQSAFTDARDRRPTDDFAIRACATAVEREVRSHAPGAADVESGDGKASLATDTRTDVRGEGSYKDASGAARGFSFRCSYDLRTSVTSDVTVNMGM
jgi:hypothetical protein